MASTTIRRFTVECMHAAEFPLDMLRSDGAYPARVEDAALLQKLLRGEEGEIRKLPHPIRITLSTADKYAPSCARWASFNWRVTSEGPANRKAGYVVRGKWPFPLDMLRHDDSRAASKAEQEIIDKLSGEFCPDDVDIRCAFDIRLTMATGPSHRGRFSNPTAGAAAPARTSWATPRCARTAAVRSWEDRTHDDASRHAERMGRSDQLSRRGICPISVGLVAGQDRPARARLSELRPRGGGRQGGLRDRDCGGPNYRGAGDRA